MELCPDCIEQMVKKLTPNDIYVLHELVEHDRPQTGIPKSDLLQRFAGQISDFQLGQAFMRLNLIGFIHVFRSGKVFYYSITESGIAALEHLKRT